MVQVGGSASRTIDDSDAPDPGGGKRALGGRPPAWRQPKGGPHRARWTLNAQGFPALGSLTPAEEKRRERSVPDSSNMVVARDMKMGPTSPSELGRGHMALLGRDVDMPQWVMRPAGVVEPSRQVAPGGVLDVKRKSTVRPLLVEAVEFSPTLGTRREVIAGRETVSSGAGGVAPAVVADSPVPLGAGVRFSAVVEVHASASEVEDDILVVQASEQHTIRSIDHGKAPRDGSVPTAGAFVSEPLEHSV